MGVKNGAGIDRTSTLADVQDAFRRQGIELVVRLRGSRWQALVRAIPGDGRLHADAWAASPDEAARRAWRRHLEEQGGTGAS
ncbi:MAG TPA: hypothetical protein VH459_08960 [Gaiellales bacterium]